MARQFAADGITARSSMAESFTVAICERVAMLFEGAQCEIALYFDPRFAKQNRGALDLGFWGESKGVA